MLRIVISVWPKCATHDHGRAVGACPGLEMFDARLRAAPPRPRRGHANQLAASEGTRARSVVGDARVNRTGPGGVETYRHAGPSCRAAWTWTGLDDVRMMDARQRNRRERPPLRKVGPLRVNSLTSSRRLATIKAERIVDVSNDASLFSTLREPRCIRRPVGMLFPASAEPCGQMKSCVGREASA